MQILRLLKKLEYEDVSLIHEILLIDNRSTDGTFENLKDTLKYSKLRQN